MTSGMFGRPRGEYFMRFRGALPVSSFLALLVCLGMAGSANAQTTVWVDDCPTPGPAPGTAGTQGNPYCSIQTAICSIKANGGTVNVLPGTYNETLRFPANVNVISTDGPVTTILNAANKSCVTSDFCTLAATTNCSAVYFPSAAGTTSRIEGLRIQGGGGIDQTCCAAKIGGGITVYGSSPTIKFAVRPIRLRFHFSVWMPSSKCRTDQHRMSATVSTNR